MCCPRSTSWAHNLWNEVIRPANRTYSAKYLMDSSVMLYCGVSIRKCAHCVLSDSRIVVKVRVDAFVNMAITQLSLSVKNLQRVCMSACKRADRTRNVPCEGLCLQKTACTRTGQFLTFLGHNRDVLRCNCETVSCPLNSRSPSLA